MYSFLKTGFIFIIFMIGAVSTKIAAQDSLRRKKVKVLPVPAFGYSPETKTYVGAVSLFTFNLYADSLTRTSNAKLEVNYTWNKQVIIDMGWNFFSKNENIFTKGQVAFSKYPDYYWGVGAGTPDSDKVIYDSKRFVADIAVLKKIRTSLFSGPVLKYYNYWDVNQDATAKLTFPELTNSRVFGLGYSLLKDTRNSILTPSEGHYFYSGVTYNLSKSNSRTAYNFSKSNYTELVLDMRYYKTWKDKFTWASRFINEFNIGNTPFYDYAFLGGDKFVRGYYYGRFRDKNLSSLQTEFRTPLIWRFGVAAFGGVSNIFSNQFNIGNSKYNGGLGLRFLVDRKDKTNLRLDYAVGEKGNNGFYVSFGESF